MTHRRCEAVTAGDVTVVVAVGDRARVDPGAVEATARQSAEKGLLADMRAATSGRVSDVRVPTSSSGDSVSVTL
ncbi:MAG: hypothetical protein LBK95_16765, partial [Bifidobacteriaceae bacterium]|nr:hypothetical protein [Bifidobacteriaceae bacterium]